MNTLLYYLLCALIYPLAYLPMWVLHRISDFLFLIVYYLIPYRKKVVQEQIAASFPEKSPKEVQQLTRAFFRHFCDIIVESIKSFAITPEEVATRHKCITPDVPKMLYEKGLSISGVSAHYNNWEWFVFSAKTYFQHEVGIVYRPLASPAFERLIRNSRERMGADLIPTKDVSKFYEKMVQTPSMICLAADQSPRHMSRSYWTTFLNQETPIYYGPEKIAKDYNCAVIFAKTRKVKRSHYEYELIVITENPRETPHGYITQKHLSLLEEEIIENPAYWLWTHRRWKRGRPEGIDLQERFVHMHES